MKSRITIVLCLLLTALFVNAEQYVHRVIIVNEGHYDYATSTQTVPVTLGVYDPATATYTSIDTIAGVRFATHAIVDGKNIYVAADNKVIRYDADTYERKATATVEGVRKLAVWNNQLIVSRGEYLKSFTAYCQVFDKTSLGFLYELPTTAGPQYATEGIIVIGNTGYIAVGNGFDWGNEVGLIGKIDLVNQTYGSEINLGSTARNPEGMFVDGDMIYTVNNNSYDLATISSINTSSNGVITTSLQTTTGCGASDYYNGDVYYQVSGDNKLQKFSTATSSTVSTMQIGKAVYGMATDPINNLLYVGETDYTSMGKINVYDLSGNFQSSFDVSVAPGNITFDVRTKTGINKLNQTSSFYAYPNPANDQLNIVATANTEFYFYDATGRQVMVRQAHHDIDVTLSLSKDAVVTTLDISSLDAGVYYVRGENSEQIKFVKQ